MTKKLIGELELNRIYQRDCIEGMRMLPDKSVDLVVIDPPYNIGKDKRWDKWKTVDSYVGFMTEVFRECERVLKPNGSFYWFHNDMNQIRKLMDSLDKTSFVFKQLITWNKIDPSFRNYGYVQQRLSVDMMRNYYNGFTEYCVYYTFEDETGLEKVNVRGSYESLIEILESDYRNSGLSKDDVVTLFQNEGRYSSYASARVHASYKLGWNGGKRFDLMDEKMYKFLAKSIKWSITYADLKAKYNKIRQGLEETRVEFENDRYVFNTATVKDDLRANSNVWLYPPAQKQGHITPKPVDMIENIIRHSSNEGDIVIDCFMGSGTTAVASAKLKRNFIGFERESEYIEIANKRLDNEINEEEAK
ncbi:DNA-methyltransferase [Priestia megaterium]|uniref:DNA-methyltransferase n=1 Tax=Priestia megaterium TaxID=1404 RepID=UPI001DFB36AF|nr:site-specific DNA-methyltransferase [Priestia megaterium]CAH0304558.1 Modification methylase MboII [Priestia megaterium]